MKRICSWCVGLLGTAMVLAAPTSKAQLTLLGPADPGQAKQPDEQVFVHPITSPYFHEDSFVTTDLRIWYLYHSVDKASVVGSGHINIEAAQIRLALTDSLQLVAYKDGFSDIRTAGLKKSGWNDVAAGLKWAFLRDWKNQLNAAAGVGYQFAFGDSKVLQNGSEARFWLSVNKGFDKLHLGATVNGFLADNPNADLGHSDYLSWHLHADYYLCKFFSPAVEFNGYHTLAYGNRVLPVQGADFTNLGGSKQDTVITVGAGGEIRPMKNIAIRAAYEKAIDGHRDLFDWRLTASMVISL